MFTAWLLVKLTAPKAKLKRSTSGDCEFDYLEETIYYTTERDPSDEGFLRHLEERHKFQNARKYSLRLWSLLHEIGHYYNADVEPDAAKYIGMVLYEQEPSLKAQYLYYNSPDEWAATEWACEWVERHKVLAKIFSKIL